jgi:hypothetical protein
MTPSSTQEPILISSLPQVTTAKQFFSIEKMIMPVAFPLKDAPPYIVEEALSYGGLVYKGTAYLITALFGSPEALFNNVANGVDVKVGRISFTYRFHKELDLLLARGIVYDASEFDSPAGLTETHEYYVRNCIESDLMTEL